MVQCRERGKKKEKYYKTQRQKLKKGGRNVKNIRNKKAREL
jgi:hypothetical protein